MRDFIIKGTKFLAFTVVIYVFLVMLWGKFMPDMFQVNFHYNRGANGYTYTRLSEVKNTKDVDILFLGSSHAYRGFDNRIFRKYGFSSFNMGTSAQTPIQTRLLLKRYLDRLHPKFIIFEVYPGVIENDGLESLIDILSNDKNDINSLKMVLEMKNVAAFNTYIYAVLSGFFKFSNGYEEVENGSIDKYIEGGFVERKVNFYSKRSNGLVAREKMIWKLNDHQIEVLGKIISDLQEKNIPVVLVYAPITRDLYDHYLNNDEFDSKMEALDVEYLNFNNILSLDDSIHFFDDNHLNQLGVRVFDEELAEIINKRLSTARYAKTYNSSEKE